jgi:MraZ protein
MALFLSTFTNKLDKKGRVSVPASFRAALAGNEFSGIIAYPSFINPCIEACGFDRITKLHQRIEALDPFSEERDVFATTILGGSVQIAFDGEGRVMLPEELLQEANITENALFVGKGETFEIWEPKAFAEYAARARTLAREKRLHLRAEPSASTQSGGNVAS